jgi:hypothetical protein
LSRIPPSPRIAQSARSQPIACNHIQFRESFFLTPKDTDERRLTPRFVSVHQLLLVSVSVKKWTRQFTEPLGKQGRTIRAASAGSGLAFLRHAGEVHGILRALMRNLIRIFVVLNALCCAARAQNPPAGNPPAQPQPAPATEQNTRLNLLGQTDSQAGENRRNENVQFNLVDNNLLRDLNTRLGTTATIITEFRPDRGYYGSEYGNTPLGAMHVAPAQKRGNHGRFFASHLNSIFSSRAFFQVGDVQPARENNYGGDFSASLWKNSVLAISGAQQKVRGMVNGNVLVPLASERTVLATDPKLAAYVSQILAAFPKELPNRTDINRRMLNTNAPQQINSDSASARLDQDFGTKDKLVLRHQYVYQRVLAFQLIRGMNPDTATRSHQSRITWVRRQNARTTFTVSLGFDRLASQLLPEKNNLGPQFTTNGLSNVGPSPDIPLDRAENMFRQAAQMRLARGHHEWSAGYDLLRRHLNGYQNDSKLGSTYFGNDQGRDGITNLRLGLPTKTFISVGDTHRRFRNWEQSYYAGDKWQVSEQLTLTFGLRYQPVSVPTEADQLTSFPYKCDCNNFAPMVGLAQRLPGWLGVVRASYALAYDNIVQATYQQLRFNPPGNTKLVINNPDLLDPVGEYLQRPEGTQRNSLYILDSNLVAPYSHQYAASWEPQVPGPWRVQIGYVGSRTPKIIQMWYINRARVIPGVPLTTATIDERRPDQKLSEVKLMLNGSFAWYDAARATFILPRWKGLSIDASYWFSKAIDLGANYSDTASNRSQTRSQSEYESHMDLKGLSDFDQPHAFLARFAWDLPSWSNQSKLLRGALAKWNFSAVVLLKSGTPFLMQSGNDSPGFGNVDGASGDRVNLLDSSVLGRTIGSPDTSASLLPKVAFSYIKPGELAGNLGRNVFRKGGIYNVNAALSKRFGLYRETTLLFRAESVNLFNTPQFAAPGASLSNPEFGMITNTLNDGRTFRFHLAFEF